ncbi:MAG: hypothetical protein O2779_03140 [Nanoarchaeota archaeon]|nr:hypothetical protein [Nanoarchaeota archaeon]
MKRKIAKKLKAKKEAKQLIPILISKAKALTRAKKPSIKVAKKVNYLRNKFKIKLETTIKRQICNHCKAIMIPSLNARVRTKSPNIIWFCRECKHYTKIRYKK